MQYPLGFITILMSVITLTSCNVEPQDITFGEDQCNYCKMTIVDQQHAAQFVTIKGKQFKFDAIECMIHQIDEFNEDDIAIFLVSNYGHPGEMTNALNATYLISQSIKSPMGEYLSAFEDIVDAKSTQKEHIGELFDWNSIKNKIEK